MVTRSAPVDVESQGVRTTSVHYTVNGARDALVTMSCSPILQGYESGEAVTSVQRHLIIDLANNEEGECSGGRVRKS